MRSYSRVPGRKQLRIEPMMRHGHAPGWEPDEIAWFIDQQLLGEQRLPTINKLKIDQTGISAKYLSDTPIVSALLHYTTDTGRQTERKWKSIDATVQPRKVEVRDTLPDAAMLFFTLTDDRGAMVSSEVEIRR